MTLVRVTVYSMGPGILVSRDTWDYPGMSLVRVTDYTAWVLEYLYPGILETILGCP